jgi:hypothetical protein
MPTKSQNEEIENPKLRLVSKRNPLSRLLAREQLFLQPLFACRPPTAAAANDGLAVSVNVGIILVVRLGCRERRCVPPGKANASSSFLFIPVLVIALLMLGYRELIVHWLTVNAAPGNGPIIRIGTFDDLLLDVRVDDVVLHRVHDERKQHHDENNLQLLVALGPTQRPVANTGQPWQHDEEDQNTDLHPHKTTKVDEALLEPPPGIWRAAIVATLDRLWRLAKRCEGHELSGDPHDDDQDRNP